MHEAAAASVRRTLAAMRLEGFEERAPHELSAGEKRRAGLAGVFACEPGLLLLDEPTGDLDPRGRRELAALLAALPATMVVARTTSRSRVACARARSCSTAGAWLPTRRPRRCSRMLPRWGGTDWGEGRGRARRGAKECC